METANGCRFLRRNGSAQIHLFSLSSSSVSSSSVSSGTSSLKFPPKYESRNSGNGHGKKRAIMVSSPAKAFWVSESTVVTSSEKKMKNNVISKERIDLYSVFIKTVKAALKIFKTPTIERKRQWSLQAEMLIERGIVDCRFFTLVGVVGSLIGSILCFLEGCFLILESYFEYFHTIWQSVDQPDVIHLVIEAIDMFLVGTAMLNFGMGLYVMFVGSREIKRYTGWLIPRSNNAGPFHQKVTPAFSVMKSVSQAKAEIGHSVVMLLQAGVVEKFKNVPLETGLDLACFAGAILVSSAGLFLLSRLRYGQTKLKREGLDHMHI